MKFSIRDLLLVTMIVALAVAWWVDRVNYQSVREENKRLSNRLDDTEKTLIELIKFTGIERKRQGIVGPTPDVFLPISSAPAPKPPKE